MKLGPLAPGDKIGNLVGDADNYSTFTNDGELEVHSDVNEDVAMMSAPDIAEDPQWIWDDSEGAWASNVPVVVNTKVKLTAIGGVAVKLTNKTGGVSVAGQTVRASTVTDDAVVLTVADEDECLGVFLDSGVADGAEAWVVVSGIADVALQDNTGTTRGNWVRTSVTEIGYADATNAGPPGGGVTELGRHMREIGCCLETVSAGGEGTHVLARCVLHFN